MLYKVTAIELDWTSDDEQVPDDYKRDVVSSVMTGDWDADDIDDLIESITEETGWCVLNVEATTDY